MVQQENCYTFKGWNFTSLKTRISNAVEIEDISKKIGFSCPEMVEHEDSKFSVSFNALDCLTKVSGNVSARIEDEGACSPYTIDPVKVIHALEWQGREDSIVVDGNKENLIKAVERPFDWTFTTSYTGSFVVPVGNNSFERVLGESLIDYEALKRPEPILFFAENVIFEDELGDNGTSMMTVKMRVMDSGFFILLRFYLRVDKVIYRIYDTRIYHSFGDSRIFKEVRRYESKWDDLGPGFNHEMIQDPNLLVQHLDLKTLYTDIYSN